MNNSTLFTADRTTHLKIVVMSLVCATMVAVVGIAARVTDTATGRLEAAVVQPSAPITASVDSTSAIR